jgi:hypothetical protein
MQTSVVMKNASNLNLAKEVLLTKSSTVHKTKGLIEPQIQKNQINKTVHMKVHTEVDDEEQKQL